MRRTARVVAALAVSLLAACSTGTVRMQAGAPFDPAVLEASLVPGVSTRADVVAALGEPYGKGGALLPFHDSPRTTWTYMFESGSFEGAGSIRDHRTYLFLFLRGDRYDGYLWFDSSLASVAK